MSVFEFGCVLRKFVVDLIGVSVIQRERRRVTSLRTVGVNRLFFVPGVENNHTHHAAASALHESLQNLVPQCFHNSMIHMW